MKEYNIQLNEDKNLVDSTGGQASEIDLALQVWQDLHRINQTSIPQIEDNLIKNILEQILEIEYGSVKDIPVPEYYTYHERHKDDTP
jgi:hypothetical protein